jgi:ribonuclease HII
MPNFSFEKKAGGIVCGIDEVGRGPLAGPVVAAALILPAKTPRALINQLDDSKALPPAIRRRLYDMLIEIAAIGIGRAEPREIEQMNILRASLLAMSRAFDRLAVRVDCALVDGPHAPALPCRVQPIVKGDSLSLSIAAASIVAKVVRDREMSELADEFPGYGWDRNAGYGTPEHLAALTRLGATPHHRRTFAPVAAILAGGTS